MADYALETNGAKIVDTGDTIEHVVYESCISWALHALSTILCRECQGARAMIRPGTLPGECWAFKGSRGEATIRFAGTVRITGISIEHIPAHISPTRLVKNRNFTYSYTCCRWWVWVDRSIDDIKKNIKWLLPRYMVWNSFYLFSEKYRLLPVCFKLKGLNSVRIRILTTSAALNMVKKESPFSTSRCFIPPRKGITSYECGFSPTGAILCIPASTEWGSTENWNLDNHQGSLWSTMNFK